LADKRAIEGFGIAEFVARCRASVHAYVDDWERLTRRIGFWLDTDSAYWTLDSSYVQSVWWHLRQPFDRGLLVEDTKVVPYCPRCETAPGLTRAQLERWTVDVLAHSGAWIETCCSRHRLVWLGGARSIGLGRHARCTHEEEAERRF
jgi:hypothetical protein